MLLKSREHCELIEQFDRVFRGRRLDKEGKHLWPMGQVYQDGTVNELFRAYREGYAFHKCIAGQSE